MAEFVIAVLRTLIPPHDADGAAVYRYRVTVSAIVMVTAMAITTHIMLACGYFAGTIIGFPGFARADSVDSIKQDVVQIEISQLDQRILQDVARQCAAEKASNTAALGFITYRLNGELNRYQQLTSREYRVPGCDVIGDQ